jgi:hypothetical protein
MKRVKIETFTIFQDDGHGQVFLEVGPRYNPPLDDTTILRVGHKTVDPGGISVLLEQGDLLILQASLELGHQWSFAGLQTMAQTYGADAGVQELTIWWKGSGRARTFHLTQDQAESMAIWISDSLMYGWTGWKSGVKSE